MVLHWSIVSIFMKIWQAKPRKLKSGGFLFFLPQVPLRALDFESLQKNLTRTAVSQGLLLCGKKGVSQGVSEKHLWWTNGCRLYLFYLKQLRGFQGSSFSFTIWGIGAVWWTFPLNVQGNSCFTFSNIK